MCFDADVRSELIKAGFISSAPHWHWERQFPGSIPVWDGVEFVFSGNFSDCEIVFVFDAIPEELSGRVFAKRNMFIASEPASVKTYQSEFLAQFDCVLTTDRNTRHPNVIFGQLGLPWLVGAYDADGKVLNKPMAIDDFREFRPAKSKLISVVSSSKAYTEGHRARLEFVEKLKSHFGCEVDVFGRNINGFGDKTEVLSAYRYHIAIENSSYPDYWTEKLSDPLLMLTYPIYHGCPNIGEYFTPGTLTQIDIADHDRALRTINAVIESDVARLAMPKLEEARRRILSEHNLFHILSSFARGASDSSSCKRCLFPEKSFARRRRKDRWSWDKLLAKMIRR